MTALQAAPECTAIGFSGHGVALPTSEEEVRQFDALRLRYTGAARVVAKVSRAMQGRLGVGFVSSLERGLWKHNTSIYQPLMLGICLAYLEALKERTGMRLEGIARYAFGISLGELIALTASGAWGVEEAAALLIQRGQCITRHQPAKGSCEARVVTGAVPQNFSSIVRTIRAAQPTGSVPLAITNINSDVQRIVSGSPESLGALQQELRQMGCKARLSALSLPALFHHPLLEEAGREFEVFVRESRPRGLCIPVASNFSGICYEESCDPPWLGLQLSSPANLLACKLHLRSRGVKQVVTVGPGPLKGLVKEFDCAVSIDSLEAIEQIDIAASVA